MIIKVYNMWSFLKSLRNKKGQQASQFTTIAVGMIISVLIIFTVLYLGGTVNNQLGTAASDTARVTNETFDPGTQSTGVWTDLNFNDIVNGSETVQNTVAGNATTNLVRDQEYVLDSVLGRINVTNGSAYANADLNISYDRTVTSNATSKGARAFNNVSSLATNIGSVVAMGLILLGLGLLVSKFAFQRGGGK